MGADLLIYHITTPLGKYPNYKRAQEYINGLTLEKLQEIDDCGIIDCLLEEKEPDINAIKKEALVWLTEVERSFTLMVRDCTRIDTKTETLWITGGLSWGDNPTETFGYLSDLEQIGAFGYLFYDA